MTLNIHGLNKLEKDVRDFKLGSLFKLPSLSELPKQFIIGYPKVVNQRTSDFCAAASSCSISELQEGVELAYEWVFAVAKMITGDVDSFGTDLRTICKVHTTYGAPERKDCIYSLENKDAYFLRRIDNYPKELFEKARKHLKASFISVAGPYDHYDNIRACMWKFKDEQMGVLFGVLWNWSLSQVLINTVNQTGFGHALAQIGWDEQGMFVQNSAGEEAGVKGRHYFSREVINAYVEDYGAFMFHDMPKEDIRWHIENNVKIDDPWWIVFLKRILNIFKRHG